MVNIEVKVKIPWLTIEVDEVRSFVEGTTVEQVLLELGLDPKDEGNYLVAVNGKIEYLNFIIEDGDRINILPALIGG